jgi:hypothetical protein
MSGSMPGLEVGLPNSLGYFVIVTSTVPVGAP